MTRLWPKQQWQLVWELAKTDFKLRYHGSRVGYLWALLFPLLSFVILNLVFSNAFDDKVANYPLHLIVGLVFWTYFSEGTLVGMNSLASKRPLIISLAVSKLAIIFSATVHVTISFLLNMLVVAMFFRYYEVALTLPALAYALVLAIITYCLILGFSLAAAPLYVIWRDLGQIWGLALRLGFFAAPIVYPLIIIPHQYQVYLWLNPMAYIIHYVKRALIKQEFIQGPQLLLLLVLGLGALAVGSALYRRQVHLVAEQL